MNGQTFTGFAKFPRPYQDVNIAPEDLQRLFAEGKSEQEIADTYGVKRKTLISKINNSRSLSHARRAGELERDL